MCVSVSRIEGNLPRLGAKSIHFVRYLPRILRRISTVLCFVQSSTYIPVLLICCTYKSSGHAVRGVLTGSCFLPQRNTTATPLVSSSVQRSPLHAQRKRALACGSLVCFG